LPSYPIRRPVATVVSTANFPAVEEADDDNMEEIDTDNIINGGRRTRGKVIDFAKAAENSKDLDDDEDDEDEDFEDPGEDMEQ
jgi:hypothetical protein